MSEMDPGLEKAGVSGHQMRYIVSWSDSGDGLAPNKSGRRMDQLASYFSYSEEKNNVQNPHHKDKYAVLWGLRLVFDFNMAYFIPFSGCFCL